MPTRKRALDLQAAWGPQADGAQLQHALLAVLAEPQSNQLRSAGVSPQPALTWLHVRDVVGWAMVACAKGGFAYDVCSGGKFLWRNWRRAAYLWLHNLAAESAPIRRIKIAPNRPTP